MSKRIIKVYGYSSPSQLINDYGISKANKLVSKTFFGGYGLKTMNNSKNKTTSTI